MKTEEIPKVKYKIGEVAELCNVTRSAIRFWENHFPWILAGRNSRRQRIYTPRQVNKIKEVVFLLNTGGLTLKAVKKAYEEGRYQEVLDFYQEKYNKKVGYLETP